MHPKSDLEVISLIVTYILQKLRRQNILFYFMQYIETYQMTYFLCK